MDGDPAFPSDPSNTSGPSPAKKTSDTRETPRPTARADRARRGSSTARSAVLARFARLGTVLLGAGLALASCERRPTKAEYVDDRVAADCAGQTGDAFTLCRLDVIKKYMAVPLEEMQKQFPAPVRKDRLGCG